MPSSKLVGLLLFVGAYFFVASCDQSVIKDELTPFSLPIPKGFPAMEIPDDNPLSIEKIALGKQLFFDKNLSKDRSISCASCHFQHLAFSDSVSVSVGSDLQLGFRNAPTLTNVGYLNKLFHDGGIPTLERQVMAPFNDSLEFNLPLREAIERIKKDTSYVRQFELVFNSEPTLFGLTRAIAAYERTLISGNSRYDQQFYQEKDVFTEQEWRGYRLFVSDSLNCISCHSGFNFTNESFQNNGTQIVYADSGRARITMKQIDNGKFKVPTLRNVAVTAPYMYNGNISTLDEVIDHYAHGGKKHPNQSKLIVGFSLDSLQKDALKAFLYSLTDSTFINNTNHTLGEHGASK